MSQTAGTDHRKGQHLSFLGSVLFEKSEKGWRPSGRLKVTRAYPSLPAHVGADHRELLIEWLSAHSSVRLATLEDCNCDDDFKTARTGGYINEHPYYVAGDFNGDGTADLAFTVIDTRKDPESGLVRNASGAVTGYNKQQWFNAGVVIFNGPLRQGMMPAFVGETVGTPQGAVLFYDAEHTLRVGNFSSGSLVRVAGSSYSLQ